MASDYRVIPIRDAMDLPSPFQWPETQQQQFAAALEETLNRMSREGWELVAVERIHHFSARGQTACACQRLAHVCRAVGR